MLCYRCGSHVPDGLEACGACGQRFSSGNLRQATGTFSRKKGANVRVEGAPYNPGDVLSDRYVIKDAIGAGPLGFVFKAHDKEIDVDVALKVISARLLQTAEERKAFAKEIRLARKLSHNNIVRVYEEGEDKDNPFYTMQYLDGLTLRRIVDLRREKSQNFALAEVEPIFVQIGNGLDNANKLGSHSDFKPENVIVLPDLLKITDFGLGMGIPRQPFIAAQKTRNAHRYLAPEYAAGHEVDRRADVFAMGVLLGEMLAGVFPDGPNVPELRSRAPELPTQIEGVYRRSVNENPLARYPSPGEMLSDLLEVARLIEKPKASNGRRPPPPSAAARLPPPVSEPEVRAGDATVRAPMPTRRPPPPPPEASGADATESIQLPPPVQKPSRRAEPPRTSPPPPPPVPDADPAFVNDGRRNGKPATVPVPAPREAAPQRPAAPVQMPKSRVGLVVLLCVLGAAGGLGLGVYLLRFVKPPEVAQVPPKPPEPKPAPKTDDLKPVEPPKQAGTDDKKPEQVANGTPEQKPEQKPDEVKANPPDEKLQEKLRAEEERKKLEREEEERKKKLANAFDKKPEGQNNVVVAKAEGTGKTCPAGMKFVTPGAFPMGTRGDDPLRGFDEKPFASVDVKGYCIDYFEYPNRAGATPMTGVAYAAAENACKSKNKRLCTEEEWEKACKGPAGSKFPYGSEFDANACNTEDGDEEERPVGASGAFGKCRSAFGVADLSGNVAEWTATSFKDGMAEKAIKGGASDRPGPDVKCSARKPGAPGTRNAKLGFRCCADPT